MNRLEVMQTILEYYRAFGSNEQAMLVQDALKKIPTDELAEILAKLKMMAIEREFDRLRGDQFLKCPVRECGKSITGKTGLKQLINFRIHMKTDHQVDWSLKECLLNVR